VRFLLFMFLLMISSIAWADGHCCRMLFSANDLVNMDYDTTLHTWALERIYPNAEIYGWIGCPLLDLGSPDGEPYADDSVWRQNYGNYIVLWLPGARSDTAIYDPEDIDNMWPLRSDGWGDSVTTLTFYPGMGIIVSKVNPRLSSYDVNNDGKVDAVDAVYIINCVYMNRGCP